MPRMAESVMGARYTRTAGWSARFSEAAPGAILGAVLGVLLAALVTFLGWLAVSLGDLRSDVKALDARVTTLEEGQKEINARLTRLETRVDDIYKLLAERLPPPQEQTPP